MDSNLLEDRKKHIESKLLSIQSHNDIDVLNEAKGNDDDDDYDE